MLLITENEHDAKQRILGFAERFGYPVAGGCTTIGSANGLENLIRQLPISTKKSLIDFRNENATTYLSEAILFAETSGTTGTPLQIPRTRIDLHNGVRNYKEAYGTILRPGEDRVAFVHPSILSPLRDITVRALQDLDVGVMTLFPIPGLCGYERIHNTISQNRVTTLLTSPSIVHQILFNFSRLGLRFPSSINKILVTGEYFSEQAAQNIKKLIDRECYVAPIIYGANEIGMMMYGREDLTYRAITRDFVFECLPLEFEDDYIASTPPGARTGELLVTGLTPTIMPVIRYATRDVFNFIPIHDGSWKFQHIGRKDDFPITLRRRNEIDDVLYTLQTPIFHYSLMLTRDASVATVQLLSAAAVADGDKREIVDRISGILGNATKIVLETDTYDGGFIEGECVSKISRFNLAA